MPAMNTTSRTAEASAAVRTNTPANSARPTAISSTGSPNATGSTSASGSSW
jgi:hypothetical protein